MPGKQRPDPSKCPEIAKGRIEFTASITQAPNASKTLRAGSSLRPQSPRPPTQRPDPSKYREIKGWTPPNTAKTKDGPLQILRNQRPDPSKCSENKSQTPNAAKTLRAGSSLQPQSPSPPTISPDPSNKYKPGPLQRI